MTSPALTLQESHDRLAYLLREIIGEIGAGRQPGKGLLTLADHVLEDAAPLRQSPPAVPTEKGH